VDLFSKKNIKTLLLKYGVRPSKGLGQNFLINRSALSKFVDAVNPTPQEVVLEVGPGIGVITRELAKRAKEVVAVEKDEKMVGIMKETLKDVENAKIVKGDILKTDLRLPLAYQVAGNIPFYLTAPLIRKFLERAEKPRQLVLVVQKEVAQRICARPPKTNLLAVSVQVYAEPKILSYISKKSFWPQPKVDSAIIRIAPLKPEKTFGGAGEAPEFRKAFFKVLKAGFSHPRKQILNNLSRSLAFPTGKEVRLKKEEAEFWLLKNGIQPNRRAENLSIEDWTNLTKSLKSSIIF